MSGVNLKNRLLVIGLILCITSLALFGTVNAQTITPGVSPGMVFDYHVSSYWVPSDAYDSMPQDLVELNQTSHIEVRISTVNETNVSLSIPYYFKNDTAFMSKGNVNLLTGEYYGFAAIIGANLNVGNRIHPNGADSLTILDAATRNYESGPRETNHLQITESNTSYTGTRDLYFDKATGMLVEQVDQTAQTGSSGVTRITWKLDSTFNIEGWVVPEFPVVAVIPVFLLIAAFAAIAYKKKFVTISRSL